MNRKVKELINTLECRLEALRGKVLTLESKDWSVADMEQRLRRLEVASTWGPDADKARKRIAESEPVARASNKSEFVDNASDKAFKETFVHQSMAYGAAKQGSVPVNRLDALARFNGVAQEAHDKALIHALRDVNTDEITEVRANLDHSGNWRATLNAFLARRRLP